MIETVMVFTFDSKTLEKISRRYSGAKPLVQEQDGCLGAYQTLVIIHFQQNDKPHLACIEKQIFFPFRRVSRGGGKTEAESEAKRFQHSHFLINIYCRTPTEGPT